MINTFKEIGYSIKTGGRGFYKKAKLSADFCSEAYKIRKLKNEASVVLKSKEDFLKSINLNPFKHGQEFNKTEKENLEKIFELLQDSAIETNSAKDELLNGIENYEKLSNGLNPVVKYIANAIRGNNEQELKFHHKVIVKNYMEKSYEIYYLVKPAAVKKIKKIQIEDFFQKYMKQALDVAGFYEKILGKSL